MNTKTLPICLPEKKIIPLYISGFEESDTLKAEFDTKIETSFQQYPLMKIYPEFTITCENNFQIE